MIPDPKDYKRLFRMVGKMTCLHSEFFLEGSLGLGDPLIVYADGAWNSFIQRKREVLCAEEGLALFSDANRYAVYAAEFRSYLAHLRTAVLPKYTPKTRIKKDELALIFQTLAKFWHYYGLTEFPYTDAPYQELQRTRNPVLRENLSDLSRLKVEGREMMNALLFTDGVIPNILCSLSAEHFGGRDATHLYREELFGLLDGKQVPESVLETRQQRYALAKKGSVITRFTDQDIRAFVGGFTKHDSRAVLRGIVARKGKAVGKAIVMPMLNDMKTILSIAERMQQGDILIAESTTPEVMSLCRKAAAIVTDQGGMLSHAAIVSRELDIPCIVGTGTAVQVLRDGDLVEVDANQGVVRKL